MYHEEELDLRAQQLLYMRDREELLDEQLMSHKDVMHHQTNVSLLQTNTLQLLQVQEKKTMNHETIRQYIFEAVTVMHVAKHSIDYSPTLYNFQIP